MWENWEILGKYRKSDRILKNLGFGKNSENLGISRGKSDKTGENLQKSGKIRENVGNIRKI